MKKTLVLVLLLSCMVISCAKKGTINENADIEGDTDEITFENITTDSPEFAVEPNFREQTASTNSSLATIYFEYDSSNVGGSQYETLKSNVEYLKKNPNINVVVEGHCDERGTTEYNLALGQKRALKIKEYYVQMGIPPNKIATMSYGEEMPIDKRSNEAGWKKNRRVETKVLSKN